MESLYKNKYMIIMILRHMHTHPQRYRGKSIDININLSGNDAKNNDYLSLSILYRMMTFIYDALFIITGLVILKSESGIVV